MFILHRAFVALSATVLALIAARPTTAEERAFRPWRVASSFPAITDAPTRKAADVDDQVTGGELVLGVVVGGEARAYPINMLTGPLREIINDKLGGRAIAATW